MDELTAFPSVNEGRHALSSLLSMIDLWVYRVVNISENWNNVFIKSCILLNYLIHS